MDKFLSKEEIIYCLNNQEYNKIIKNFTPLVVSIANNFFINNHTKEDLNSIGMIGLIEAVKKINPQENKNPVSYFYKSITNELVNAFNNEKKNIKTISLNLEFFNRDGDEFSIENFLKEEVDFNANIRKMEAERIVNSLLEKLSEENKMLIEKRYGLNGCDRHTQQQLADNMGIKRSTLAMRERNVLKCMRKELCSKQHY